MINDELRNYCNILCKECCKNFLCSSAQRSYLLIQENAMKNSYDLHYNLCTTENLLILQNWYASEKKNPRCMFQGLFSPTKLNNILIFLLTILILFYFQNNLSTRTNPKNNQEYELIRSKSF